jgi:hypothetical protein
VHPLTHPSFGERIEVVKALCWRRMAAKHTAPSVAHMAAYPPQRPFYRGHVAFGCVEAVLGDHRFVPSRHSGRNAKMSAVRFVGAQNGVVNPSRPLFRASLRFTSSRPPNRGTDRLATRRQHPWEQKRPHRRRIAGDSDRAPKTKSLFGGRCSSSVAVRRESDRFWEEGVDFWPGYRPAIRNPLRIGREATREIAGRPADAIPLGRGLEQVGQAISGHWDHVAPAAAQHNYEGTVTKKIRH